MEHSEAPLDHMATVITEKDCLKHSTMIYGGLISCDIPYRCYFYPVIECNHNISSVLLVSLASLITNGDLK